MLRSAAAQAPDEVIIAPKGSYREGGESARCPGNLPAADGLAVVVAIAAAIAAIAAIPAVTAVPSVAAVGVVGGLAGGGGAAGGVGALALALPLGLLAVVLLGGVLLA